jgi:NAD(P)-dependent dehydrogenase (short-subunit alcohol dehydrogenase family)
MTDATTSNSVSHLAGRRALVTGGASGIGAGISRAFAAAGAHVTVADVNVPHGTDLSEERGGDLLVTASLAGLAPIPPDPIYGLTKHAVVGLVRSVAPGMALHRISISSLNPGFVDTPILSDDAKKMLTQSGLTLLTPEELGEAALHAIRARRDGAQWVIWPGHAPQEYAWAPAVPLFGDAVPS